ncbi:uncharacterized protein [Scyliorhinus torazame]|uniref:uncharacterized protein n=1 Tax=Scyliorhinus torazame TaxID=75743 RepID=UPI003B59C99B
MCAQAVRSRVNARFISRIHKTALNVFQTQHNAIRALKTNRSIVIKPADKRGATVILNRTGYCKDVYWQLNNQGHYRQLPADPTKEHTRQLNRLIKTLDRDLQSTLHALIPLTPCVGDLSSLPKIHKANTPDRPIVSGNGTLCEHRSGYIEGILKPIVQGTPSFCCDTTDFLQKLSTHGTVEPGTFPVTMDVSALYTSIPHDDGTAATASVLNTDNCQSPDAILQLIRFILDHNVFTFDNKFFIQTHGTAMGTKFAPQYANIFMHKFEQDLLNAQDLQPTLYSRYINYIFFLWTHAEESLKRLHDDITKFHPTIRRTIADSPESVAFLDTLISIKDGHLSTSLYRKPTGNLMMLHFSSFHPKHIKEAIPYGQALHMHRICSVEEERNRHLQTLKDALLRTDMALDSSIDSSNALQQNTSSEEKHGTQPTEYPSSSCTSPVRRNYNIFFASFNTSSMKTNILPRSSPHPHDLPSNNRATSNKPLFAANYPAFRTATTTPHNPAMAISAICARSSTWIPPLHVRTPPIRYVVHTHATRPTLSTSYAAGKDVPKRGTLARPCRRCDNE